MTEFLYNQANADGTVNRDEQSPMPRPADIKQILETGLSANGWSIKEKNVSRQPLNFVIEAADKSMDLYIYSWRISNGGRKDRENEQRIQIGSYDNSIGFDIGSEQLDQKGLLMGIYQRDDMEPIIVSWQIETNRGHGSSKSCFTSIQTIAEALRDGFVQSTDNKGNLICAFRKEFLNFYIKNLSFLHNQPLGEIVNEEVLEPVKESTPEEIMPEEDIKELKKENFLTGAINKIIYGAPGTGKSNSLGTDASRITFHPEYTYHDFVGSLKPYKDPEEGLTYKFMPGPFLRILEAAYNNPEKMHTLIIEELNRANTAAVFGDVFQLLDRDAAGWSEYSIENNEVLDYLNSNLSMELTEVRIPGNLNIYATMNSSDQGVFVMDSAFKRRWEFDYKPISFVDVKHAKEFITYRKQHITWENFITTLNEYLTNVLEVSEDKLIGPYFLKAEEIKDSRKIANKLLIYLWDDVARHQRDELFNSNYKSFTSIMTAFISNSKGIFTKDLETELEGLLESTDAPVQEEDEGTELPLSSDSIDTPVQEDNGEKEHPSLFELDDEDA